MENMYLDRLCRDSHSCHIRLTFSKHDRASKCDSLVYQYSRGSYRYFRIESVGTEYLFCKRLQVRSYKVPGVTLPWDQVGVARYNGEEDGIVRLNAKAVHGKVFRVKDVIVAAPRNVLEDK